MLKRLRIPAAWCPPEAAALAGAVFGILAWQYPRTAPFAVLFLLLPRCCVGIAAVFLAGAFLSGALQDRHSDDRRFPHYVQAEVCVTDLGISPQKEMPSAAMAEALPIRLTGNVPVSFRGKLGLRFPREYNGHPRTGDILAGTGIISFPDGDYGRYLAGRGIRAVLALETCREIGHRVSWRSCLASFRERLAEHAIRYLEPAKTRLAAASLFFGIKGGLDRASRRELVNAGVIHLYSVSGLHVGILTAVLLLLFRPLPFRLKYTLLIPVTLFYVLSTGANIPAVRAWIMIAVWAGCRAMLRWMPVRTVLGYSAAGMLVFQPAWICDMGFLYSFGITMVLILLGDAMRDMKGLLSDPAGMMPRSALRGKLLRELHFRNRLINAVLSCCTAFLGGAAVSLIFQGRFLPGSIPANLLLMPAVGLLFPLMALKISCGWLFPGMDKLLAGAVSYLWNFMESVAEMISQGCPATVTGLPAWWSILLFLAGMILLFSPRLLRHSRIAGMLFIGSVLIYWHGSMFSRNPAVLIRYGSYAEVPAVAIADTAAGTGCIINVPDAAAAAGMADFFLARGIAEVDRVGFSASRTANIKGLRTLGIRIPVRQVIIPARTPYDHAFRARLHEVLAELPETGDTLRWNNLTLQTGNNGWNIKYRNPASGLQAEIDYSLKPEAITVNGQYFPLYRSSESTAQLCEL